MAFALIEFALALFALDRSRHQTGVWSLAWAVLSGVTFALGIFIAVIETRDILRRRA